MTKRKTVGWLVFSALMIVIVLQLPRVIGDACYVAGAKFYSARNYEAAATSYRMAVLLNPGLARAYVELGSSFLALKNYRSAEHAFLKARSIQDESCAACGLGMTYHKLRRYDDAERAFKRAQRLDPNDVCAYEQSGRMYYEQGKYQEAIAAFKRVLTSRSSFASYMYLGNAYVYAKEYEPSVDAYKEAIHLEPKDARAHLQLGIAYDYLVRYENAVEEYKEAIKLDPEDEKAHRSLFLVYLAMRNKPAALAEYEVFRKINPEKAADLFADSALLQDRERGKEKL
jgi:tetratricopeptide (TPR) repeat protein